MLAQRYRLLRRVATGGMGTVHEAFDERLGRRVAVKILNANFADEPDCVERFSREACAAAGLIHPNIAQIFDSKRDAGQYFIVMEYVDGDDLGHELSQRTRLLPAHAVKIADQLCSALAAAHAAGIVHRDIKPSNVLLGPGDRVKLTDFGIAKARGQAALTATGLVLGSANYLSPEQADGQTATPASDLYSAGIVLFEMLTGTVPFTGPSPVAVAHDHLTRKVPPVDGRVSGVPPTLAAVVARATAKNPSDRFADATAMQAELRDSVEPTGQRPSVTDLAAAQGPTPPADAAREPQFGPLGWVVAAAALVAAALAVGWMALVDGPSSQPAQAAHPADRPPALAATPRPSDPTTPKATARRNGALTTMQDAATPPSGPLTSSDPATPTPDSPSGLAEVAPTTTPTTSPTSSPPEPTSTTSQPSPTDQTIPTEETTPTGETTPTESESTPSPTTSPTTTGPTTTTETPAP